ncbi:MAG: hypothetical protein K8R34_05250 [Methanosarcinales archaeon]|nr:hypothetical protein [Methanosarcinales archaeon]
MAGYSSDFKGFFCVGSDFKENLIKENPYRRVKGNTELVVNSMFLYRGYFLHPFFSVARKIASVSPALRFIDTVWTINCLAFNTLLKASKDDLKTLNIEYHEVNPSWNYTLYPN